MFGRILFIFSVTFFFRFHLLIKKKDIVSVSWKAITWGPPLVIAPYNESVGLTSSDSILSFHFRKRKASFGQFWPLLNGLRDLSLHLSLVTLCACMSACVCMRPYACVGDSVRVCLWVCACIALFVCMRAYVRACLWVSACVAPYV